MIKRVIYILTYSVLQTEAAREEEERLRKEREKEMDLQKEEEMRKQDMQAIKQVSLTVIHTDFIIHCELWKYFQVLWYWFTFEQLA